MRRGVRLTLMIAAATFILGWLAAATDLPRTGASAGRGLLVGGAVLLGRTALAWRTRGVRRVRS
jgi:hypothetical protein